MSERWAEINHRVKGTGPPKRRCPFWNRPAATEGESLLQVVASLLSEGDPLSKHILSRPGSLDYRRSTAIRLADAANST